MENKEVGAICLLETKTTNTRKIERMGSKMGFYRTFTINLLGFAGLMLLWNPDRVDLKIKGHTSRAIHCITPRMGLHNMHFPLPMSDQTEWRKIDTGKSARLNDGGF